VTATLTQPESIAAEPVSGGGELIPADRKHLYRQSAPVTVEHDFLQMQIDEGKLYVAPLPIMSGSEDRDSEVTDPAGVIVDAYRMSRPVYFNHSHAIDPLSFPVGTCETPDHKFDLHRTATGWDGGTLFHQSTKLAEQTFALVLAGVIRGRSIGALGLEVTPYTPKIPRQTLHNGRVVVKKPVAKRNAVCEMVEFSWTPMQANRDIVTMYKSLVSRNRVDGATLDPTIGMVLKSLIVTGPQEPANNLEKSDHTLFSSRFSEVFTKGVSMKSPVAVQFCAEKYTVQQATALLRNYGDLFPCSDLSSQTIDDRIVLKSVQLPYEGEVVAQSDERFPGMTVFFAKGSFFDQSKDPEEEVPGGEAAPAGENSAVQRIIEQATGEVHIEEPAAAPAAAPAKPEQPHQPKQVRQMPPQLHRKRAQPHRKLQRSRLLLTSNNRPQVRVVHSFLRF